VLQVNITTEDILCLCRTAQVVLY